MDQINDEVAVDTALEDLSVMTASESEMSCDDQILSMEVLETSNTVTRFVGDNIIDLNIVSINGHTTLSNSPFRHHLCQIHR